MKTSLTVVPYYLDDNEIEYLSESPNDILALSMSAMSQLDRKEINYLTLNSFITQEENFSYLKDFSEEFILFLKKCDELAEESINVEHSFSFNGFRFFHRLSHLMFSQVLMDKIDKKYDTVSIFSKNKKKMSVDIEYDFSSLHFPMDALLGVDGLVNCFLIGFSKHKLTIIPKQKNKKVLSIINYPPKIFLRELPGIVNRRIKKNINKLKSVFQNKEKIFWVTDISYDLEPIKKMNPHFKFIPITHQLIKPANACPAEDTTRLESEIEIIGKQFFRTWLPRFTPITLSLFKKFTSNIVSRIPSLHKLIETKISDDIPQSFLLASGFSDILEGSISQISSSVNIPTFSFKHTGIESVFFNPQLLDQYRDYNQTFARKQFVHIDDEKRIFNDTKDIDPIFLGNLKKKNNQEIKPREKRRIIYSAGPTDCTSFHSHYCNLSDKERHIWSKELINLAHHLDLSLDIKVHPAGWEEAWEYYSGMIAKNNKTIKLIAGGSVERKIESYDLIILDMVPTQVLSSAITLGKNILIFKQHDFLYNPISYKDLEERVHFVSNGNQLKNKLLAFDQDQLENRSNETFNNKYLSYNSKIIDILSNPY